MKTKIPVKKYVEDTYLSWEDRYRQLLAHHEAETKFLVRTIERLEHEVDNLTASMDDF